MTREEAIKWLKHCAETDCDDCAYEIQPIEWCSEKMAYCVSVLEEALSEPSLKAIKKQIDEHWYLDKSGDLISRADVHKTLNLLATEGGADAKMLLMDAHEFIDALPSADRPTMIPIELEKRYPNSKDEDITDAFMRGYQHGRTERDRPSGEWQYLENEPYSRCSVCGAYIDDLDEDKYNYCPSCGARMEETK